MILTGLAIATIGFFNVLVLYKAGKNLEKELYSMHAAILETKAAYRNIRCSIEYIERHQQMIYSSISKFSDRECGNKNPPATELPTETHPCKEKDLNRDI
jgi:hypothetical protein